MLKIIQKLAPAPPTGLYSPGAQLRTPVFSSKHIPCKIFLTKLLCHRTKTFSWSDFLEVKRAIFSVP